MEIRMKFELVTFQEKKFFLSFSPGTGYAIDSKVPGDVSPLGGKELVLTRDRYISESYEIQCFRIVIISPIKFTLKISFFFFSVVRMKLTKVYQNTSSNIIFYSN